ncbi:MAG: right-handed parallel beta-helix repeat-containing protein [Planctomycetes bacterium]|nr:right-handed parallel beta-helix repeat-containing protein [Planctomycetota bacterium]MBI3843662.1 right-handed parallel beta-helix repeat-containing protein [Planctomycetota bacterium]
MKTTGLLCAVMTAMVSLAIGSSEARGGVRFIYPSGTSADLVRVQSAINAASPGDTLILKYRNTGGIIRRFNLANVPSGGIVIGVEGLNIVGEVDTRNVQIATKLVGPTTYDASGSFVAFDVQADDVHLELMSFENFEAAVVLEEGVSGFTMDRCKITSCAHGIFGIGDNNDMTIRRVKCTLAVTPEGGNAGVTLQEGSDRVTISHCTFDGPGMNRAPLAVAGVIDFNLQTSARRLTVNECDVEQMDIGIFVSSKRARILQNLCQQCIDGIELVTEVGTGLSQGTQQARENLLMGNRLVSNDGTGIHLFGAQSNLIKNNLLTFNGADIVCQDSSLGTSSTENVIERNIGVVDCADSAGIVATPTSPVVARRIHPVRP